MSIEREADGGGGPGRPKGRRPGGRPGGPPSPRTLARRYAVLALYQWQLTGEDPAAIERHYLDDPDWLDAVAASVALAETGDDAACEGSAAADDEPPPDPSLRFKLNLELLHQLILGVPARVAQIDAALDLLLDRPIGQVDPVELAILRLGAYEILFSPDIPDRVAINEAVELAKLFGSHEGHRYVNGVLDKLSRQPDPAGRWPNST